MSLSLNDFCIIDCIGVKGTVIETSNTVFGEQYTVRYFGPSGEPMKERFFPNELSICKGKKSLGFKKGSSK